MLRKLSPNAWLYWLITAVAFGLFFVVVAYYTPREATMGMIQKIFYLHLPVAICMLLSCAVVCVASLGYLTQRRLLWDDLAVAAAKTAVVLGAVVLITGMIWARGAWGVWWTWSPKLSFAFVLWLLYLVYMVIRPAVDGVQRRAMVSSVYGVVAFLDVPLVYLSSRMMNDIHPASIELAPAMTRTLLLGFIPVVLMTAGLIVCGYTAQRLSRQLNALRAAAADDASLIGNQGREVA